MNRYKIALIFSTILSASVSAQSLDSVAIMSDSLWLQPKLSLYKESAMRDYCASSWNRQLFFCSESSLVETKGYKVNAVEKSYYTISPSRYSDRCMTDQGYATLVNSNPCNGSSAQKWEIWLMNGTISVRPLGDSFRAMGYNDMGFNELFLDALRANPSTNRPLPKQSIWNFNLSTSAGGSWSSSGGQDYNHQYNPEFTFTQQYSDYVELYLDGHAGDAYLTLIKPNGEILRDDDSGDGYDSKIRTNLPAGTYKVVVGTYKPNYTGNYTLTITSPGIRRDRFSVYQSR
ncbi:hypothetical protein N474_20100 [Pseudoalteromonas luteoviolacea CPMOR-2]|uniref:hypothetical protein n=1 Tax=Pseudoalteromonas luteoviolacea TaxID=43657 RepID=UPI0007B0B437|nr:hypothetical protein [Pseudoalteromonas luteoviolacea]KZN53637.1 hypothetical protein N474_20100 [Pseudoalteromonas luteoviolacea CPMOR-2]